MKNWIKENWLRIVITVIIVVLLWQFFGYKATSSISIKNRIEKSYTASPLSATGDITCTYPQGITGFYNEEKISYEIPPPEKNPMIFTFTDTNGKEPKLRYIDSTQTISEVSLVKLSEDAERIVLVGADKYYVELHTIFKNSGVSLYSKQVSLMGIPLGRVAVGTCIDS